MQRLKTGALIRFACEAGAILGARRGRATAALRRLRRRPRLAFQIQDDLLDRRGRRRASPARMPAATGAVGKATFVGLLGEDGARGELQRAADAARSARLDIFGRPRHASARSCSTS